MRQIIVLLMTTLAAGCTANAGTVASPRSAPAPTTATAPLPTATSAAPLAALAATAPPAQPESSAPATPAAVPAGVVLTTYVEAQRRDGRRSPFVSGQALHSGERFWMHVSAQERLYVYVIFAAADGSATVVYPERGDVALEPSQTLRVPATQDFELDGTTGTETILLVASRQPLGGSTGPFEAAMREVRANGHWPEAQLALRPNKRASVTTERKAAPKAYAGPAPLVEARLATADTRGATRGIHLAPQAGRIDSVPDEDGMIAIPLVVLHLP